MKHGFGILTQSKTCPPCNGKPFLLLHQRKQRWKSHVVAFPGLRRHNYHDSTPGKWTNRPRRLLLREFADKIKVRINDKRVWKTQLRGCPTAWHKAQHTVQTAEQCGFETLPHSAHLPDLSPSEFFFSVP